MVQLFDMNELYHFLEEYTDKHHMKESSRALRFAKESHQGQLRKEGVPFIIHPLIMARSAVSMGITEDNIIAVMLLHDVCEDCGLHPQELPFNQCVRKAVERLTFCVYPGETKKEAKVRYFLEMRDSREAVITKITDRCNNISSMAGAFSQGKMMRYIEETESCLYPLMKYAREQFPEFAGPVFLMEYQLGSVIGTIRSLIKD